MSCCFSEAFSSSHHSCPDSAETSTELVSGWESVHSLCSLLRLESCCSASISRPTLRRTRKCFRFRRHESATGSSSTPDRSCPFWWRGSCQWPSSEQKTTLRLHCSSSLSSLDSCG